MATQAPCENEDKATDNISDRAGEQDKARQQENRHKAGEARWMLIGECQMVVLSQKAAWPLIPDLSDDEKIEAAWTKLQQMIERGEATLAANLMVRGEPGEKLVAESFHELRYATEFQPPELPDSTHMEKSVDHLKNWPYVGITPTAFETRNVGTRLELTGTVSQDGQWISVETDPSHVRFLRFEKIDAGVLASGEHLSVEQPHFSTLRNVVALQIRAGQRILLGVHKIPTDEDNMEFFFLRVRTQRTGKAP